MICQYFLTICLGDYIYLMGISDEIDYSGYGFCIALLQIKII